MATFTANIQVKLIIIAWSQSFTKICQLTAIFLIIEYVIQYIWKDEYENILHSRKGPTYIFLYKAGNYFVWQSTLYLTRTIPFKRQEWVNWWILTERRENARCWEQVKGTLTGSGPVICLCTDCWLQPLIPGVVFVQPATYFALRAMECRAVLQWERGRMQPRLRGWRWREERWWRGNDRAMKSQCLAG